MIDIYYHEVVEETQLTAHAGVKYRVYHPTKPLFVEGRFDIELVGISFDKWLEAQVSKMKL
jgi:hypothetical protein